MLAITDESDLSPTGVVNNGSGTLINTGLGRFLVTNDHVYQAFQNRHDARRVKLLMSAKDAFIDISDQPLVDRDPDFDLAVLRISEDLVDFHGKTYSPWPSWPSPRPEEGMGVYVYGYPKSGREILEGSLGIRTALVNMKVASVGERHFILADVDNDLESTTPTGAKKLTSLGGMSGSAVYVLTHSKDDMFLGGFMCQANSLGIIVAYADRIRADGTMNRS
jgi:hypothetical protein